MKPRILIPLFLTLMVALWATTATPQATANLLEKAIFTEETVGDLDEAIRLYKQVLEDAQANRKLAAQAQFRLAKCYLKKGQDDQATDAFEQLIEDYPDQKGLVKAARADMPGRLVVGPVPWEDGEVLRMIIKLPTGLELGTFAWMADKTTTDDGTEAWRLRTNRYIALNGTLAASDVIADAQTFRPIRSRFDHTVLGDFRAQYSPTKVTITADGPEKDTVNEIDLDETVYDNEEAVHLIRRLPLAVGYKTKLPILVTFGTVNQLDVKLNVEQSETVTVPAGKFECYKVVLDLGHGMKQSLWFTADEHRYLVKLDAEGVVGELISIGNPGAEQPNDFRDPKLGFTMSAPAGWFFYQRAGEDDPGETTVHLIDPDATAIYILTAGTVEAAGIDPTQPLRTIVESHFPKIKQRREGYTVRPDSWTEQTIHGNAAVSYTADYTHRGKAMVEYRTAILGKKTAANFRASAERDQLEAIKPRLDAITATFEAE